MRSQTLLAQKPKRVGQLANVGAKLINKNETAKLFGNFLSFNNFFAWFEGCSQFKSSGTGSQLLTRPTLWVHFKPVP